MNQLLPVDILQANLKININTRLQLILHQNNHILFLVIYHTHHRWRNSLEQGGAGMCAIAASSSNYTQDKKWYSSLS